MPRFLITITYAKAVSQTCPYFSNVTWHVFWLVQMADLALAGDWVKGGRLVPDECTASVWDVDKCNVLESAIWVSVGVYIETQLCNNDLLLVINYIIMKFSDRMIRLSICDRMIKDQMSAWLNYRVIITWWKIIKWSND